MRLFFTLIMSLSSLSVASQSIEFEQPVVIDETGGSGDASAILDVRSTTKGVLVPRLSDTEYNAIPSPATGLLVYDETNDVFVYYDGSIWVSLSGEGSGTDDQTISFTGTTLSIEDGNSQDLSSLQDGVNDADADPTNEIQDINLSGTDLSISSGSTFDIRQNEIRDADFDTRIQLAAPANHNKILISVPGTPGLKLENNGHGTLLFDLSDNDGNSFIGYQAGLNNEPSGLGTGQANIFIGHHAGTKNVDGFDNTFMGMNAGLENLGSENLAIGAYTNRGNTGGERNTIIGTFAGGTETNHSKSGNVFLGYRAGENETSDNKLYIDNSNTSDPLIYGNFDSNILTVNGQLYVGQHYYMPNDPGTNGDVLGSDGGGHAFWTTVSKISDADGDTKIQVEESSDEDIIRFDIDGIELLRLSKNADNILLVEPATSRGNNTLYGLDAGQQIVYNGMAQVEGFANTLFGFQSGKDLSVGNRNACFGSISCTKITSAENNTIIGSNAGGVITDGSNNTAVGTYAAQNLVSGRDNTFIGNVSGSQPTGDSNTYVGAESGHIKTGGSRNTFIGHNAGKSTGNGSGNIMIGYSAGFNASVSDRLYIENTFAGDPLIYGEFDNDILRINGELQVKNEYAFPITDGTDGEVLQTDGSGNVDWGKADIIADADGTTKIQVEEGNNDNTIRFDATSTEVATMTSTMTQINHPTSSTFPSARGLRIHNSGANDNYWNLYTTNSSGHLELYSKSGGNAEVVRVENDGDIHAKSFIPTSDIHQKQHFTEIDANTILNKINQMSITKWQYKGDQDWHIGPMAQDFYAAFGLGSDDKGINLLDGQGVALAAIKALKEENDDLRRLLTDMMERLSKLESRD